MNQRFVVTPEHIKLLRAAYVSWDGVEFGAPAIDCKRPYGNGDVYEDMGRLLGIERDEDDEWGTEQIAYFDAVHKGTKTALQIVLATGQFRVGVYEAESYTRNWKLVNR